MMENILRVKWDTGGAQIDLDAFFPCTQKQFRDLMNKLVKMDWEHQDELRETLKVYFQERVKRLPLEAEESRRKAAEYRKQAAGFKKEIRKDKAKRKRLGLPPDDFRLCMPYENAIAMAQEAEKKARQLDKAKPKFEWYLEYLKSK